MVPGWLVEKQPSPIALAAYVALALRGTFRSGDGVYDDCTPSYRDVGDLIGRTEGTAKRAIAELVELGAVVKTNRGRAGSKEADTNSYRVIFGQIEGPVQGSSASDPTPKATKQAPSPKSGMGRTPVTTPRTPVTPGVVTGDLEPRTQPQKTTTTPAARARTPLPDDPNTWTAAHLLGEWVEVCRIDGGDPPSRVKGQIARLLGELLNADRLNPEAVRTGLAEWHRRRQHPSTLPSFVHNALLAAVPPAPEQGPPPPREVAGTYRTAMETVGGRR